MAEGGPLPESRAQTLRHSTEGMNYSGPQTPFRPGVGEQAGGRSDATPSQAVLKVHNLSKTFQHGEESNLVLDDISFDLLMGEFIAIVGPSGCGKSSLLNILSGIDAKSSGEIAFRNDAKHSRLPCAYMFQNDLLMPWRTILDNVALGLIVQGVDKKTARETSHDLLERFHLHEYADKRPVHLSGGMRQRVALIRTMALERPILLLDEPFGALDALTRAHMQDWLLDVWEQDQRSVIFVTHDVEEAIFLADKVLVFDSRPGRLKSSIPIAFSRPRTRDIQAGPEFANLKSEILAQIYFQQN